MLSACSACSNCVPQQQAWLKQTEDTPSQGFPNSVLEGHSPVEFLYNQLQKNFLEGSSHPGETLISWFRCVFIGVGAKLCRKWALQDQVWTPLLPLGLTLTLPVKGFPKPVQKERLLFVREIWALIKTTTGPQKSTTAARLAHTIFVLDPLRGRSEQKYAKEACKKFG